MPNFDAELAKLYSVQAQLKEDSYLHAHSRNLAVICHHTSTLERSQEFLIDAQSVLDWGCRHARDACMVRMLRGLDVELYGEVDSGEYHAFFNFVGRKYSQLSHPYLMRYEDNSFDAAIGNGVREHVPNDSESLKELYGVGLQASSS